MKITIEENGKQTTLEFLSPEFLIAMNDIGRYGFEKYGEMSFQARRTSGEPLVRDKRTQSHEIADHAQGHFRQYLRGDLHDYFNTEIHQLAAASFNCMMEAIFEGLDKEAAPVQNLELL